MHYFFELFYKNLHFFENNPYLVYYPNIDGYDIFKVSYAFKKSKHFMSTDMYYTFSEGEVENKLKWIEENEKDEKRFVYYLKKLNDDKGYYYSAYDGDGLYMHGYYGTDYVGPKEVNEKIDESVFVAISKIDKNIKPSLKTIEKCPNEIPGNIMLLEYITVEIKDCDNFKFIGDNIISSTQIKIENCPNFTHIGKNFFSNKSVIVTECVNFSKIKRGIDIDTLYVAFCKNFDLDSLSFYSKINKLYIYDSGFGSDIIDMFNGENLDEIDDYLSSSFPNVNIASIMFSYSDSSKLSPEHYELIKNHFDNRGKK